MYTGLIIVMGIMIFLLIESELIVLVHDQYIKFWVVIGLFNIVVTLLIMKYL